jgi:hypothetical protein
LGLDATTVVHGKNDKSRMGGYFILEYDRDIYKNIDYLSGSVTCRSFGKTRETKINIYDAVFRKNGSISAKSLNNLTHQVKIPNTLYFDMFLRFVVLFVFIIAVIEFF